MELQVKAQASEWQGRTVWRAYYLDKRTWKRYGKWEAASAQQLKDLVNYQVKFSNVKLTWKD